jgi:ketosteroid isomerase-like protein
VARRALRPSEEGNLPPSGAPVDLRFADISRVEDGQVVSYHTYYDQFALFTQLGLFDEES